MVTLIYSYVGSDLLKRSDPTYFLQQWQQFQQGCYLRKINERELTAIFRSMDTLIIEFDKEGRYIKVAPTNNQLLYKPADQIIGQSLYDIFQKDQAITNLLSDDYHKFDDKQRLELINSMQKALQQVGHLLENLLSWAHSQRKGLEVNKETHNLSRLVNEVVNGFKTNARQKQIQLTNQVEESKNTYLDINITRVILRNLISNAIKFTDRKGQVIISSGNDGKITTIYVSDTGKGISTENVKRLFTPNQTQTTNGTEGETGNGLGLTLCKEFTERQGGTIHVKSKEGAGSCFYFTIPSL